MSFLGSRIFQSFSVSSFETSYKKARQSYEKYLKGKECYSFAYSSILEAKNMTDQILKRSNEWDKGIFRRRQLIPVQSAYLSLLYDLSNISQHENTSVNNSNNPKSPNQ